MELLANFRADKDTMLQIMDDDGKIIQPEWKPDLSDQAVVEALKRMLYVRTADQMAVSFQRQGRMYTYPPNFGQEAVGVGFGMVIRPEDWVTPAYRELGVWLAKGLSIKELFLYFAGNEDGSRPANAPHWLPMSVPIASQLLHAVGIGYALKYRHQSGVAFGFCGDGGTSEGDFHEALNFSGVWKVPVVFVVQNNQYAISLPRRKQTAAKTLSIKALAYGIEGIQVDGNDFFAVYAAAAAASAHAQAGQGPVLIEAVTYRRGAHTTSDDPTRYRTSEEENFWVSKDPVKRLRAFLIDRKLWDESKEAELSAQYKRDVEAQFEEVENYPPYKLEDVFRYHFKEMPDELKKQMISYQKFANWKESRQ